MNTSSHSHNRISNTMRSTRMGIRLPIAGVGFACAFVLAVFAWLMQLSTFWLPVLTGDVRYGHGVCIKLDTQNNLTQKQPDSVLTSLHAKTPSKTEYIASDEHSQSNSSKHSGHDNHHAHASHHAHHDMHDISAHSEHSSAHQAESHDAQYHNHHEHHMMSESAHDNANTIMSMIQSTAKSADDSNSNHCDICMLLASVSSLDVFDDFRFHIVREAQTIATNWLYRQRLETTFEYILPPSRAPPVFS